MAILILLALFATSVIAQNPNWVVWNSYSDVPNCRNYVMRTYYPYGFCTQTSYDFDDPTPYTIWTANASGVTVSYFPNADCDVRYQSQTFIEFDDSCTYAQNYSTAYEVEPFEGATYYIAYRGGCAKDITNINQITVTYDPQPPSYQKCFPFGCTSSYPYFELQCNSWSGSSGTSGSDASSSSSSSDVLPWITIGLAIALAVALVVICLMVTTGVVFYFRRQKQNPKEILPVAAGQTVPIYPQTPQKKAFN
eukprot:TRINITY_DN4326_c0_g1_i1.p1 TRINITY_DN4326_c0_g1~~TRINITY_DN4326_c0_g1_i1.p1  ORF type:complete len:251 (+),score=24.25 TRINITY_DN4326_c0_g1_i1:682-1434(+)